MLKAAALFIFFLIPTYLLSQTVSFTYKSINNSSCNPDTIQFTPNAPGNPVGYLWDFGNSRKSHSAHPSVIYVGGGAYKVKLLVIYSQGTQEFSDTVVVNSTINPSFSYDKDSLCQPGTINFSATGAGSAANYNWNFGDGTPAVNTTSRNISHFYATYGTFTVTLMVTSASGCFSTSIANISVHTIDISGTLSATQGCIPSVIDFTASVLAPPGEIVNNYLWTFGDGSPPVSTGVNNISYSYNTTGKFLPKLTVNTAGGCTGNFIFDSVAFGIPPTNLIAYTQNNVICGSETAVFIGKANNALSYLWNNGESTDEVTDTISKHKYSTLGNKNVVVTPYFNGCQGTADSFNIDVIGVIAKFDFRNSCSDKKSFVFTNRSLGNVSSIVWDFGDGSPRDSSINARHTYADTGAYVVTLTVEDSITGCSDSLKQTVSIAEPVLSNPYQAVCRNSTTTFTVLNVYPGIASKYVWNVVGKRTGLSSNNVLNITADQFGVFNASDNWVLINNGASYCYDTIYLNHAITVRGPVVDFTSNDTLCLETLLDVNNRSIPFIAGENIVSWDWNFGDGSLHDSSQNPEPHEYSNPGRYNVSLAATDLNGCSDIFNKIVTISDDAFIYTLPRLDTLCSGQSKILIAYEDDSITWSPANFVSCATCDTITASPTQTTKFYATSTNAFGCSATDSILVKVYQPFTATTPNSNLYVCPDDSVQLNVEPPFYKITWSPAAGLSNPNAYSPNASPSATTTYTATLTDSVGCFTSSVDVVVHLKALPTVDAGPDQVLPYYSNFTISPTYGNNIVSYLWTPSDQLNCTSCPDPTGTLAQKETYTITVTSDSGCVAQDKITIFVECKDSNLLLPNAFTPNNDNLNDVFYPITRGIQTILDFSIYNRAGQLVYHRKNFPPNDKSYGWKGFIKSQPVSTAVFVYTIEALCDSGEKIFKKGSFVLIR